MNPTPRELAMAFIDRRDMTKDGCHIVGGIYLVGEIPLARWQKKALLIQHQPQLAARVVEEKLNAIFSIFDCGLIVKAVKGRLHVMDESHGKGGEVGELLPGIWYEISPSGMVKAI